MSINAAATIFSQPNIFKKNDQITLTSITTINCSTSLNNRKEWKIYKINDLSGQMEMEVLLETNPTLFYAELVLQPQTLSYGVYLCIFSVTMLDSNLTSSAQSYIKIIPSGLVLSSLKASRPMYGGILEISRGQNQTIQFDPFLFTYDIDGDAIITSLVFKYTCQIIDSNLAHGYPQWPSTNQTIYLDDLKFNSSLSQFNTCFNSTSMRQYSK